MFVRTVFSQWPVLSPCLLNHSVRVALRPDHKEAVYMTSDVPEVLFLYIVYQEALCYTNVSLEMEKKIYGHCNFNGGLHSTQRSKPPAAWTLCGRGQAIVLWCLLFVSEMAPYRRSVQRILLLDCALDTFVTDKRPICETVMWWEMGHGSVGTCCGHQNLSCRTLVRTSRGKCNCTT